MQMAESRKRIEWIDALRGFTMILVVFSHVEISGFVMAPGYARINDLFRILFMPLFFFVSGFIAYRSQVWQWGLYRDSLLKKIRVLLLPMLFFGLLYAVFFYAQRRGVAPVDSIVGFFNDSMKYGYWFTVVLLGMFLIYYSVSFFSSVLVWCSNRCCFRLLPWGSICFLIIVLLILPAIKWPIGYAFIICVYIFSFLCSGILLHAIKEGCLRCWTTNMCRV